MEITAAVLRDGDEPYSLERIQLEGPGEGEVLVRIAAVGMCHSDANATGVPRVAESALAATRVGGECALVGILTGPLALKAAALNGKTLVGVVEGDSTPQEFSPRLIALWSSGKLPIERLIEQFPLTAINDAEQASLSGRVVNPVLVP